MLLSGSQLTWLRWIVQFFLPQDSYQLNFLHQFKIILKFPTVITWSYKAMAGIVAECSLLSLWKLQVLRLKWLVIRSKCIKLNQAISSSICAFYISFIACTWSRWVLVYFMYVVYLVRSGNNCHIVHVETTTVNRTGWGQFYALMVIYFFPPFILGPFLHLFYTYFPRPPLFS